jgi:hypothetical protein
MCCCKAFFGRLIFSSIPHGMENNYLSIWQAPSRRRVGGSFGSRIFIRVEGMGVSAAYLFSDCMVCMEWAGLMRRCAMNEEYFCASVWFS